MGISRLMKLIKKYAPEALTIKKISDFQNKKVAVDAMLLLYRFGIAIRSKGKDLTRSDGEITSHLHAIFYNARAMLKNKVLPIYVFDGRQPEIKQDTLQTRKDKKTKAEKELEELNKSEDSESDSDQSEKIKHFKRTFMITEKMVRESQKLLDFMGVPYVQAPHEADSQSAALTMDDKVNVYGVASEDMDHLPFGAPYLLRNFSHKKDIIEISLNKLLKTLELTHEEFIDMCILMGTDYCPTIKGLGFENAYTEYKKVKNMPRFIEHLRKINIEYMKNNNGKEKFTIPRTTLEVYKWHNNDWYDFFLYKWRETKRYYLEATVTAPHSINLEWRTPQRDTLVEFLVKEHEFSRKQMSQHLNELSVIHKRTTHINKRRRVKPKKRKTKTKKKSKRKSSTNGFLETKLHRVVLI